MDSIRQSRMIPASDVMRLKWTRQVICRSSISWAIWWLKLLSGMDSSCLLAPGAIGRGLCMGNEELDGFLVLNVRRKGTLALAMVAFPVLQEPDYAGFLAGYQTAEQPEALAEEVAAVQPRVRGLAARRCCTIAFGRELDGLLARRS